MGGGVSLVESPDITSERDDGYHPTTAFRGGKLLGDENQRRRLIIDDGNMDVYDSDDSGSKIESIDLESNLDIFHEKTNESYTVTIRTTDFTIWIKFKDEASQAQWSEKFHKEIVIARSKMEQGHSRGLDRLLDMMKPLKPDNSSNNDVPQRAEVDNTRKKIMASHQSMVSTIPAPAMKIVILVVGTRGDVQPFVNFGLELKSRGHDIRIATHAEYRGDVVREGLKFYPLAGDPRKLSEYMVKTAGRLIPDLLNEEERAELPEKMQMLRDICFSTWPACTKPDPEDDSKAEFVAEAIISNPVTYGHIHCAEALAVPLHIMFPQPWYPTKAFPHPLSNLGFENKWSLKNRLSYRIVNEFFWIGLGSIINEFRRKVLLLPVIRSGEGGESLLVDLDVPISHMWSPSFVPRCVDWPSHVDVVGDFLRSSNSPTEEYMPDTRLQQFLQSCGANRPIYIGFGSMVISDPQKLVEVIKGAAEDTGFSVILQSGWTKYADDYEKISDRVMVVGAMPHNWLFQQVSATIHHGGAGTTSAGLRAGNPAFICPFFGDQHFWAEMVYRAGVGPRGCPIGSLTKEKLVEAFKVLESHETKKNVAVLSQKMNAENGVRIGAESFFRNLPLEDMLCEVSLFRHSSRIARVYCQDCGLKMCSEVDAVVHRPQGGRSTHTRMPYRCVKWGVDPPSGLLEGLEQGVGAAMYEFAGGIYDLVAKPIEGAREGGAVGAAVGVAKGVVGLIARPIKGGGIMIDRISQSVSGDHIRRNRTVAETVQSGVREVFSFIPDNAPSSSQAALDDTQNVQQLPEDAESLTPEAASIEESFVKASHFRKFWMTLDLSGDRFVNLEELKKFMPAEEAEALLQMADCNHDGELTFAELASNIIRYEESKSSNGFSNCNPSQDAVVIDTSK
mmetsp:Transcript_25497/g.37624  ORF Transcript_25497/g.37624 Transcript_25497/m.37624 type:complete len:901 (+) Transcript_25497:79-2781(+)